MRFRTFKGRDAGSYAQLGKHEVIEKVIKEAWRRKKPPAEPST